jgi:hypothetical protein
VLEHLLGQEVQHVAVAAGERGREPGGTGLPAQRQAGQLQPGGPPLGAGGQRRHRRFRQCHAGDGRLMPQLAKAHCQPCPMRRVCLAGAVERREPYGVWGGEIFTRGAIITQKRPRGRPPGKLRSVIGVDDAGSSHP